MRFIVLILLSWSTLAFGLSTEDPRYCGFVPRDANGDIKRSSTAITKFRSLYPCPSTGLTTGACPGWSIDHTLSLAIGGCDAFWNMAWLPNKIKKCASSECKDRWERKIYPIDATQVQGYNPKCCVRALITFDEIINIPEE